MVPGAHMEIVMEAVTILEAPVAVGAVGHKGLDSLSFVHTSLAIHSWVAFGQPATLELLTYEMLVDYNSLQIVFHMCQGMAELTVGAGQPALQLPRL